jgi:hypothetical protein
MAQFALKFQKLFKSLIQLFSSIKTVMFYIIPQNLSRHDEVFLSAKYNKSIKINLVGGYK